MSQNPYLRMQVGVLSLWVIKPWRKHETCVIYA
ncbi:TRAP transporter fused permease subunit [Pseudomonas sp. S60]|nr:TRAP transporter fused permease subunit [Pseudomonas sp. S60]